MGLGVEREPYFLKVRAPQAGILSGALSGGVLEGSWSALGSVVDSPGGLLEVSWRPFGRSWMPCGRSWRRFRRSWRPFGGSWALLEASRSRSEALGSFLDALGSVFACSCS